MTRLKLLSFAAAFVLIAACGQEAQTPAADVQSAEHDAGAAPVAQAEAVVDDASAEEARAAFDGLIDQITAEYFQRSPESATYYGVSEEIGGEDYDARWSLTGLDARAEDRAFALSVIDRLSAVDPEPLDHARRITRETTIDQFDAALAVSTAGGYGETTPGSYTVTYPITQLSGVHTDMPSLMQSQHPIRNANDAENYVARLYGMAEVLDGVIETMRADAELGVIPPDFVLDGASVAVASLIEPEITEHSLYTTFETRMADAGVEGADGFLAQAADALETSVYPAYGRLALALEELRADAVHDAGIWRLPNGAEVYQALIRMNGDSTLTAQEIHDIGLAEVDRITAEMDAILQAEGLTEGTVGERMMALGEDERFVYPDTDEGKAELITDLNEQIVEISAILPDWFATIPTQPIEVRRIEPFREASAAGGYASAPSLDGTRPGIYWINLRTTAIWPSWSLPTLTYHEGYPGHLFAGGVAQGQSESPLLQRVFAYTNAYGEGWALYAEKLAKEMGLYDDDPYGDLGRLQDELHRAIRLVTDTGMHALQWSREDALTYMIETEGLEASEARVEIERYAAWPSQALGYKMGMLKIEELRARAEAELGDAFDIREFHDVILLDGGLPLPVLERKVDAWIAEKQAT